MAEILSIIAPIFSVIGIGYIAVQLNLVEQTSTVTLGRFVLYFALPSLILLTLTNTDLENAIEPMFLAAYGGGTLLTYALMFALAKGALGDDVLRAGVKSLGASYPNSAFIGYPLLLQAFDNPPIAGFAMALMFDNVIMVPLVLTVLELGAGKSSASSPSATMRLIIKRLGTNPIILAIVIGLVLATFDVRLPSAISGTMELLGKASAGVALFFVGASLAGGSLRADITDIAQIASIKLVVHPLVVATMIMLLPPFNPNLQHAAVLIAACPMLSMFPILSSRYGHTQFASSTLLITTSVSFVTISLALALL